MSKSPAYKSLNVYTFHNQALSNIFALPKLSAFNWFWKIISSWEAALFHTSEIVLTLNNINTFPILNIPKLCGDRVKEQSQYSSCMS